MEKHTGTTKGKQQDKALLLPDESLWISHHALVKHWQSDLQFMSDELNFFRLLVDKHLMLLIDDKHIENTRRMIGHIMKLESTRVALLKQIDHHLLQISAYIQNPFSHDSQSLKDTHEKLATEFARLIRAFRSLKNEVFSITENAIQSDKMKRLIDWA